MIQTVVKIVTKKKNGKTCTEDEKNIIVKFIKEHIILLGGGEVDLIGDIQLLFPIEYSEGFGYEFE